MIKKVVMAHREMPMDQKVGVVCPHLKTLDLIKDMIEAKISPAAREVDLSLRRCDLESMPPGLWARSVEFKLADTAEGAEWWLYFLVIPQFNRFTLNPFRFNVSTTRGVKCCIMVTPPLDLRLWRDWKLNVTVKWVFQALMPSGMDDEFFTVGGAVL